MRSCGFVFTINNYSDDDIADVMTLYEEHNARYYIMGFETGSKGTPHIQGYVYFYNARTPRALSKLIPRAHIEVARASGANSFKRADYCRKDGSFVEVGEEPAPGRIGRDYLESVMNDPFSQLQAYNQYGKYYKKLTKGNKDVIRQKSVEYTVKTEEELYDEVDPHDTYFSTLKDDFKSYDYESTVVIHESNVKFNVKAWLKGFPSRVMRGYEVLVIDPDRLIVCQDKK